jgi:hypothetical protein
LRDRLGRGARLELKGNGLGIEGFRQGILVSLEDVSVGANDRLYLGDLVVGKVVADLD